MSTAHAHTVAFLGIDARPVEVQVHILGGLPAFKIVGLPDKAVAEAGERVRAALAAIGLALPPKRIVVNLAPADLPKEGSHFDLPIALGLLAAMNVLPKEEMAGAIALGELALDGRISAVAGVLPAAMAAVSDEKGLICPATNGGEAAWASDDLSLIAAPSLLALINHIKGTQVLTRPTAELAETAAEGLDMADIRGQETAKRALEIAAAGGHNLLMVGPPGAGKSMLAARLPGILPPLDPGEALEVSLIASLAGLLADGKLGRARPYRNPHHNASMAAMVGGGRMAKPGEVSLAHLGVLFLDELPEFNRQVLDALRQPVESGEAVVARANAHVRYPSRIQLVAAMNPCRCGYLSDPARACSRAPRCGTDYQSRVSGPLYDRIDLQIEVPAMRVEDLGVPPSDDTTGKVAGRVAAARARAAGRAKALGLPLRVNAEAQGGALDAIAPLAERDRDFLTQASDRLGLTARGYHRVIRVARTIADLEGTEAIARPHLAEALSLRRPAVQ